MRGPLDLQDELMAMPEWKTLERVRNFNSSIRLLERNATDLLTLLHFLTDDPKSWWIGDVKHRAALDRAFEEVLRLLHNFVASALTLVDHTRILHAELYLESNLFLDYQQEVEQRLAKEPLIQFVQKLRHLTQHRKLPNISYLTSFVKGEGTTRTLHLHKEDLLTFDGWNAPARQFLDSASDKVDLSAIVRAYLEKIREFYRWMAQRQREIHKDEVAAVEAKQVEAWRAMAPMMASWLASGLQIREQGVGRLPDIFAPAFSPEDWVKLSGLEDDLPTWVEEALKIVESKFGPLPANLTAQVRDAARH